MSAENGPLPASIKEALNAVAALLRFAMKKMDVGSHQCEKCGLTVRHNFPQSKAADELLGMIAKVERLLSKAA